MTAAMNYLEQRNPTKPIEPATPQQLKSEKETRLASTIQIEFWGNDFTFTNGNDEPLTGTINSQAHQTALLRRAMERARDEGKKLVARNGTDTLRLENVTDGDIALYCREY